MYKNTTYKVKTENGYSEPIQGNIGIKQGDNLSPLLFDIFINDVCNIFSDDCDPVKLCKAIFNCLMYADDLLLVSESEEGLQKCLDKLAIFCDKSKLEINMDKTK
jgi:hypothetical protein